jgi:hypothetical protein
MDMSRGQCTATTKAGNRCKKMAKKDGLCGIHGKCEVTVTNTLSQSTGNTQVVRIRRKGGVVVQDCDIYIGRQMSMGGWKLSKSKWHNPYSVKEYGLDTCLEMFEDYIRGNETLMSELEELDGKVLGCWCHPSRCHGDILIKLLQEQKDAQ